MKHALLSFGTFGLITALTIGACEFVAYTLLAGVEMPQAMDGVTSITSIGFAIWYGWYVTTKAVPKIVDQFTAQIERIEAAHGKQLDSMTVAFREELRAVREKFSCHGKSEN